jgi:hypothetical protein
MAPVRTLLNGLRWVASIAVLLVVGCGSSENHARSGATTSSQAASGTGGAGGAGVGGAGGAGGTAGSGGSGGQGPFAPGPHGSFPQVVNNGNGPVLATPKVQLIAWSTDPYASEIDAFITELTQTPTWAAMATEYGVGALTKEPSIVLTTPPPAMFDDGTGNPTPFQTMLAQNLSGASPAWGAADPETIYLFLLPSGTDISSSGNCCTDFDGYHSEAVVGSMSVAYAITCHCPAQSSPPLTSLEVATSTVIHELIEAATDPFVVNNPAFSLTDDAHAIWTPGTSGGEVSDMCENNADAYFKPAGAKYTIERSWSNAAAAAGTNPCVPLPNTDPYFNSVPVLGDAIALQYNGAPWKTTGVKIPVGQTKSVDVQLFSDAPTAGPWTVSAYDLADYLGTGKANLTLSLDQSTGKSGDVLHLSITVVSVDPTLGAEGFVLVSDLGGQQNIFIGAVGN